MVPKVFLQDFLPILGAPQPKIGKIWKLDPFGRLGQKDRIKIFGGRVTKIDKKSWSELLEPLASSSGSKYFLQVKILEI